MLNFKSHQPEGRGLPAREDTGDLSPAVAENQSNFESSSTMKIMDLARTIQTQLSILSGALLCLIMVGLFSQTARGDITFTGNTINGTSVVVGDTGIGSLSINGSSTLSNESGYIGRSDGGNGTVSISDGTWTNNGTLVIGTGSLTINGTGTVIVGATLSRGANGTINLESGGTLQIGTGSTTGTLATNLTNNGTVIFNRSNDSTLSSNISGTGALSKNGTGNLTLSGSNAYTGNTTINSGTLTAATAGAVGNSTQVIVNNGGSFLVTADGAIGTNTGINLASGNTKAGLAFSGNYDGYVGALTLSADSIIDLGTSSVRLVFGSIAGLGNYNLSIWNWSGNTQWSGSPGGGTDQLSFTDASGLNGNLSRISFYSDLGQSLISSSGFAVGSSPTEIIAVPEPGLIITAAALLAFLLFRLARQPREANRAEKA